MASEQRYLPSVQGLRGLAAFSVLVVHLYGMPFLAGILPPGLPAWAHSVINTGGRGVELFFVISGYLIPASLVRHRVLSKFFYDRALRIMPLFTVLHLTLFVVGPIVGYKFFLGMDVIGYIRAFLANLFFVPEFVGEPVGQQNAWTLTYEWIFYFWFAALYVAMGRRSTVSIVLIVLVALVGVLAFPIAAYFGVGMILSKWPLRFGPAGWKGAVLGLACIGGVYGLCDNGLVYLGLPFAFAAFAMVLNPVGGFSRMLEGRALQFVGKVSYSLYLIHPFILFPLVAVAKRLVAGGQDPWLVWLGLIVIGVGAALIAATISYELVEVRLRRWLDGQFRGRPAPMIARLEERSSPRS